MLRRLSENPLRLPHLSPYVPGPDDPAIFWFNSERKDILAEVERRVAAAHAKAKLPTRLLEKPRNIRTRPTGSAVLDVRRASPTYRPICCPASIM